MSVTEVQRSTTTNGITTLESYLFAYIVSGTHAGLLQSATLRRQVNGGSRSTIREIVYAYYDGTNSNGNLGDLETATEHSSESFCAGADAMRWKADFFEDAIVMNRLEQPDEAVQGGTDDLAEERK